MSSEKNQIVHMMKDTFPVILGNTLDVDNLTHDYAFVLDAKGYKLFKRNPLFSSMTSITVDDDEHEKVLQSLVGEDEVKVTFGNRILAKLSLASVFKQDFADDVKKIVNEKIGDKIVKEFCIYTIPKVKEDVVWEALCFFRAIYNKYNSEACAFLILENGEWSLEIPKQEVTHTSVDYASPESSNVKGTIHSHCDFSDFYSGTDDKDDFNFDGFHVVIGNVDSNPTYSCSIAANKTRFDLTPEKVLEIPQDEELVPQEWMDKVSKKTYSNNSVMGFYSNAGNGNGSPNWRKNSQGVITSRGNSTVGHAPGHQPNSWKSKGITHNDSSTKVNAICCQCKQIVKEEEECTWNLDPNEIVHDIKFGCMCDDCIRNPDKKTVTDHLRTRIFPSSNK